MLTSVTLAAGTPRQAVTTYGYDEVGQLTGQTDAVASSGVPRVTTFEYDALGRRTARTLPGGARETVTYDTALDPADSSISILKKTTTDFRGRSVLNLFDRMDRVVHVEPAVTDAANHTVLQAERTTVDYTYTPNGQRAKVVQSGGTARTVRYAYDALGRLANEAVSGTSSPFAVQYDAFTTASGIPGYDRVGNRRSRVVTSAGDQTILSTLASAGLGTSTSQQFDARDQLLGASSTAPGYLYDANGNTTQFGASGASHTNCTYDAENRLITQIATGSGVTLAYDADGNRVAKTVGTGATATTTYYLEKGSN